jgi:Phage terminase large subunit/Terminase RNaseH-like domain
MKAISQSALEKALRARKTQAVTFDVSEILFDKQLAFVSDPSNYKVAVCSRRAGKTVSCAAYLIDTALNNDGVACLYITLTRASAKKIIWKELLRMIREHNIKVKINLSELSLTFKNDSIIYLSGASDSTEIEKFRGLAIKLAVIDESQSFRAYIRDLIDDVIAPALMDYAGTLCLIGTPGPIPQGFFYDISTSSDQQIWARYHWTFFDNPYIEKKSKQTHQYYLERELKRRGLTVTDPSVQREFFGKWVTDSDALLIRYDPLKNDFSNRPSDIYHYIMGIDLGFNDADAIAIVAWSDNSPITYLVEECINRKQGLTELVQQIRLLQQKYNVDKMVIDEGGLGKKLAEELRRQHQLPVQAADKARKHENIAFLNDALRTGRFKAKKDSRFAADSYLVEIDVNKTTPERIRVSDSYHSDIIDAVLYAFKESPAFSWTPPEVKPKVGSQEWSLRESERMFEDHLARAQANKDTGINPFERELDDWRKYK